LFELKKTQKNKGTSDYVSETPLSQQHELYAQIVRLSSAWAKFNKTYYPCKLNLAKSGNPSFGNTHCSEQKQRQGRYALAFELD